MILLIDNYDSFTYNIYQYVSEQKNDVDLVKNNQVNFNKIDRGDYSHIIISPGPGTPIESGQSIDVIKKYHKKIPILGVCLGHQAIGHFFGSKITNHTEIYHGKVSYIYHNESSLLYKKIPNKFKATRYHSLVIDEKELNTSLLVNAKLFDGTIMGIEHTNYPLYGVQFHPESIETEHGKQIIVNFLNIV